MKSKRAFSLIELSIVILIIGILVAGITQGMSLYQKMKLESARSLTNSSPVNGIYGLSLWLDATATEAFNTTYNNNDPVALWKDSNPQQSVKSDASQSKVSLQPLYVTNGINGLPALKCDGVDDSLAVTSGSPYFSAGAPSITNNFTVFLVAAPTATRVARPEGNSGITGTSGQKYVIGAAHGQSLYNSSLIAGMGVSLGTNGISVYEHAGSYMPALAVYNGNNLQKATVITISYDNKTPTIFVNGTSVKVGLTSTKNSVFPSGQFCSGSYGAFSGYIGEIIVYNKKVTSSSRQQVEKYLAQKWGIKI